MWSLNKQKSCHTFSIEASALPQWVTMFNILSSAPPKTNIRIKNEVDSMHPRFKV